MVSWRLGWRRLLMPSLLVLASLGVGTVVLEVSLRLFPALLPSGLYGAGRLEPALGMNVHGGPLLYNKVRRLLKVPNEDGFMDIRHEVAKPPGRIRIGVFGDSYVEALQVPHEDAFFRHVPDELAGHEVETLGFGIGGWGTLHSMINCRHQAPRYDLDIVVYAFVENDLGDNDFVLQNRLGGSVSPKPYALLSAAGSSYEVRWLRPPGDLPFWFGAAKWAQSNLLLARVVWDRMILLRKAGLKTKLETATAMAEDAGTEISNSNALPSTWRPEDAERVKRLGQVLLGSWREEVSETGREFVVLYIPRSEAMLRGTYGLDETWRPWLGRACQELGIKLIDPLEALRARLGEGVHVYDDHLTAAGHEVVGGKLTEALTGLVAGVAGAGPDPH